MTLRPDVLWKLGFVALVAHAGCSVEDRTLSYGKLGEGSSRSNIPEAGETSTGSGGTDGDAGAGEQPGASGSGGGSRASDGGAPADGGVGNEVKAGASSSGGTSSNNSAGTSNNSAGTSGASSGGSSSGVAGSGGAGAAGSTASGGDAGTSGSGGMPDTGPCGDSDRNGVQDCQETLAKNSTFDSDIQSWSPDFNVTQKWVNDDAWKQATSGSLSLTYATAGGGEGWVAASVSQCLKGWADQELELGARAFIADGQSGTAQISVAMFGNDGCADSFLGITTPAVSATTGSWQSLRSSIKLETGTRSVLVRLIAAKPSTQASLEVRFDDVLVRLK